MSAHPGTGHARSTGALGPRLFGLGIVALLALATGCFKPAVVDGKLQCGSKQECPSGFSCVADRCWRVQAAPADACKDVVGPGTKVNSTICACGGECASGFCADGVCCATPCEGLCMACNLPSASGECSRVPGGAKPTDAKECPAGDAASCGQDGTCDGAGACRRWVKDTACQPGVCDGDGVSAGKVCDGKGTCGAGHAQACFPFSCDPATGACEAACTTHCAIGQQCVANSCGKKMSGASCAVGSECVSGFCADSVCCNVACSGPCVACNQTGAVGRCEFIASGLPDPAFCAADDRATCGSTGLCDGFGSCAKFPANTAVCSQATCAGDTMLASARSCDGLGLCRETQLLDCAPYRCAQGACKKTCAADTDCAPGKSCTSVVVGGATIKQCGGAKKNGVTCGADRECESSQCVDGVCCESACGGACRSCALQGSLGLCTDVARAARDPHTQCIDTGATSCGTNGMCDGVGACQKYAVGSRCGEEACVQGAYTPPPTCNNQGQCVNPPARTCSPFLCEGSSKCLAACTKDTDCIAGHTCQGGTCGLKPAGAACAGAAECLSGFCAQGVCCNTDCKGACLACNLSGSPGICTKVDGGAPDPQEMCLSALQTTCLTTGKCEAGACAKWGSGVKCAEPACPTTATLTPASLCDGKGVCVTPANRPCLPFMCATNACKTSCASDADCIAPNSCDVTGSCGLKPPGAACNAATQCADGFCTEGVCCKSACTDATGSSGLCRSCKVAGNVGTCTPVGPGGSEPKGRCVASAAAAGDCSNDGTCDGTGACRPWSAATGCRVQSCAVSTLTLPANCDGLGACHAPTTTACTPFVCNSSSPSCLTTCTKNADCVSGLTCLKTTNSCGSTLPNGTACLADTDCANGHCSGEGVCCDSGCAGPCQSCLVPMRIGACSNIGPGGNPRDPAFCPLGATCGNTSKCDGNGQCALANGSTPCNVTMSCTGATMSGGPSACNGMGSCATPAPVGCQLGYVCAGNACATTCPGNNSTCAPGYACAGAACRKVDGQACAGNGECASGACVSNGTTNICCAQACTDVPCGTSALCASGGSACSTHVNEACGVAACSVDGHSQRPVGACDGVGTCVQPLVSCAAGFLCVGSACATTCVDDTPCDVGMGFTCKATGLCAP